MKVILLQDVKALGKRNDMVEVKDGYAKNYLLKRNLAVEATAANVNVMKSRQKAVRMRHLNENAEAEEIKGRIDGKKVVIRTKAGENGKLYGSITNKDVAEALEKEYNVEVDKKKIAIPDQHIKAISTTKVPVKIYPGITAEITVVVEEEK